jgi:hypothetical protein
MASVVDICNLALGCLGDRATLSSIDPPEGSAQAEHCAAFYPVARDSLLELHAWNFATRRVVLAQLDTSSGTWSYAYARPANALKLLAVLPPEAGSDDETQPYEAESRDDGATLILTDQAQAQLRYTAAVADPTLFPPLFVDALTWLLASHLAGPLLKGDAGSTEAKRCLQMAAGWVAQAKTSDANQRRVRPAHTPPWLAGR